MAGDTAYHPQHGWVKHDCFKCAAHLDCQFEVMSAPDTAMLCPGFESAAAGGMMSGDSECANYCGCGICGQAEAGQ